MPIFDEYKLEPSDNVVSISKLQDNVSEDKFSNKTAIFLTTFQEESNPVSFKNIVLNAIELNKLGSKVYLIVKKM